MPTLNSDTSTPTIHQLPEELLKQPIENRFELALQHWLDLYPATTSLRFGQDPGNDMFILAENMYGPRLEVMTTREATGKDAKLDERRYHGETARTDVIAKKLGVNLRSMLASDPSAELYYSPRADLHYDFLKELVTALNQGLTYINCRTHIVQMSDRPPEYIALDKKYGSDYFDGDKEAVYEKIKSLRDSNATLVWKKSDAFASDAPNPAVYEALAKYFVNFHGHPVTTHATVGDTIEVKPLDTRKWIPTEQTEVERIFIKAKNDLTDPNHPWAVERGLNKNGKPNDPQLYAYIASQFALPPSRNGTLLYEGLRTDTASATNVGYVVNGRESCGTSGIQRDVEELMQRASAGQFSQVELNYLRLPDVLVSAAYHAQVTAHQKERAVWNQKHPVEHTLGIGPVMTKPISDLQIGDYIGVGYQRETSAELWCKVTKREGDVVTLFVENGHWDFQLDTTTNKSLAHDVIAGFAEKAQVVYTAPIPIKDGALYNEAIEYMRTHAAAIASTPSL